MFSFLRRNKKNEEASDINAEEASQNLDKAQQEEQPVIEAEQPQENTEQSSTASQAETAGTETAPIAEQAADFEEMAVEKPVDETKAKPTTEESTNQDIAKESEQKKMGFFTRLKNGLSKTRQSFTESLAGLVLGRKEIDEDLLDDLEMILLTADVGIDATDRIIKNLTEQVSRKELKDPEALINALKIQLQEIIDPMSQPLDIDAHLAKKSGPFVILMVGINGVGKTTTIGKLAKKYQLEGKSVMLAAGDTFRAAAVEQLQTWGERNNVPVMAQKTGADSAAVIFDAIQSAKAKNIDVLIADTAGRLHTQSNLMEELKKVKRVIAKVDETAPHEVMLVIDAGTGQNALNQAQQFQEAVDVSGITLTKLDGTAKGGIVFALAEQRQIPIRFIGVGESIDDLRSFDSKSFTEALFDQSQNN